MTTLDKILYSFVAMVVIVGVWGIIREIRK